MPCFLLGPGLRNPQTGLHLWGMYWVCRGVIVLAFDSAELDALAEDVAPAVVAHELAHAYIHAVAGVTGEESLVDAVAASWGFDMAGLRALSTWW